MKKKILITGCAGFIGFNLSNILKDNFDIVGIDNLTDKSQNILKKDRLKELKKRKNFNFFRIDISNFNLLNKLFKKKKFDYVINLAAIAGVRNSIKNPDIYLKTNMVGFYNIYKLSLKYNVKLLIFGSSSSVYGDEKGNESNYPISFYAATKKCNEIISHSFKNFSKTKIVGLRFFTVYGPWGRPDMAVYKFTNKIYNNKTIDIFNYGKHGRDFSYIDDVVKSIDIIIANFKKLPKYKIFDIGKGKTDKLSSLINLLSFYTKRKIKIKKIGKQSGDVENTKADMRSFNAFFKYKPKTSLKDGINKFINWYKNYHNIK